MVAYQGRGAHTAARTPGGHPLRVHGAGAGRLCETVWESGGEGCRRRYDTVGAPIRVAVQWMSRVVWGNTHPVSIYLMHAPADITFEQVAGLFSRPSLATSFPGTGNTIAYAAHDKASPLVPFKCAEGGCPVRPGGSADPHLTLHLVGPPFALLSPSAPAHFALTGCPAPQVPPTRQTDLACHWTPPHPCPVRLIRPPHTHTHTHALSG